MKKNLFLRLCLMMIVVLTLNSCRQDILPEQETYHNTSAFQLTSKKISLNEAKHKAKLTAELSKAKDEFKAFAKKNVQGKTVNFGDSISVNTDDVIYMENGPNYHTYTFSIQRSNPLPDAPVENLVFTPLPDGGYKAYLVTYNFSEAEKNIILNGGKVPVSGKSSVTPLEGVFSSMMSVENCTMQISDYYTWCSAHEHNGGEVDPVCKADNTSQHVVVMEIVCQGGLSPQSGIEGPGDGGSGEPGGSTSPNPCSVNGVYTNPQDPDNSDCNGGVVTAPNLPDLGDDPCRKTKASITSADNLLQNPTVQTQMDGVLKGKVTATKEWSVAIGQVSNGYEVTPAVEQNATNGTVPASQLVNPYIADGHSHAGGFGDPSGGDLYGFLENILTNPGLKYRYVYGNNFGVTETYALVLNDKTLISNFLAQFPRSENYDPDIQTIKEDSPLGIEFYRAHNHSSEGRNENNTGEMYRPAAVAMAYIFEKYNVGVSIAKADTNGNLKKINASVEQIAVPHSSVKEGVKISKCP